MGKWYLWSLRDMGQCFIVVVCLGIDVFRSSSIYSTWRLMNKAFWALASIKGNYVQKKGWFLSVPALEMFGYKFDQFFDCFTLDLSSEFYFQSVNFFVPPEWFFYLDFSISNLFLLFSCSLLFRFLCFSWIR